MNYRAKVDELIKELNGNKNIEVIECLIGKPKEEQSLKEFLSTYGVHEIPSELMEIYKTVEILEIQWKCDLTKVNFQPFTNLEDENEVCGLINIYPIEYMLMSDDRLKLDSFTEDEKEDVENFRVFAFNDEYITFGLFLDGNKVTSDLYYIQEDSDGFSKPDLSLEEYLNQLLKNKGIIGWESNILYPNTHAFKRMNYYLDKIFR